MSNAIPTYRYSRDNNKDLNQGQNEARKDLREPLDLLAGRLTPNNPKLKLSNKDLLDMGLDVANKSKFIELFSKTATITNIGDLFKRCNTADGELPIYKALGLDITKLPSTVIVQEAKDALDALYKDADPKQKPTTEQINRLALYINKIVKDPTTSEARKIQALRYILIPDTRQSGRYRQNQKTGKVETSGQFNQAALIDFLGVKDFAGLVNLMNNVGEDTSNEQVAGVKRRATQTPDLKDSFKAREVVANPKNDKEQPNPSESVDRKIYFASEKTKQFFFNLNQLLDDLKEGQAEDDYYRREERGIPVKNHNKIFNDKVRELFNDYGITNLERMTSLLTQYRDLYISNKKHEIYFMEDRSAYLAEPELWESYIKRSGEQNKLENKIVDILENTQKSVRQPKSPEGKNQKQVEYDQAFENANLDAKKYIRGLFKIVDVVIQKNDEKFNNPKNIGDSRVFDNYDIFKLIDNEIAILKIADSAKKELEELSRKFKVARETEAVFKNSTNKQNISDYNSLLNNRTSRVYVLAKEILDLLEKSKTTSNQQPNRQEVKNEFPVNYNVRNYVSDGDVIRISIRGNDDIEIPVIGNNRLGRSKNFNTLRGAQDENGEKKIYPLKDGRRLQVAIDGGEVTFKSDKKIDFDVEVLTSDEDDIGQGAAARANMVDRL